MYKTCVHVYRLKFIPLAVRLSLFKLNSAYERLKFSIWRFMYAS